MATGSRSATTAPCRPGAVKSLVPRGRSYAVDARGLVRVYRKPDGRAFARFGRLNVNGVPTVFSVLDAVLGPRCRAAWYRVLVPMKPNGTTGFIRARAVNLGDVLGIEGAACHDPNAAGSGRDGPA